MRKKRVQVNVHGTPMCRQKSYYPLPPAPPQSGYQARKQRAAAIQPISHASIHLAATSPTKKKSIGSCGFLLLVFTGIPVTFDAPTLSVFCEILTTYDGLKVECLLEVSDFQKRTHIITHHNSSKLDRILETNIISGSFCQDLSPHNARFYITFTNFETF